MKKITLSELTHELNADKNALNDYYMVVAKDDGNSAIQTMRVDGRSVKAIRVNREQFYMHGIELYNCLRKLIKTYGVVDILKA